MSNCNVILNWLTFSNSKDVGKEEERDSEAVSFSASSATLFLCDLGTSLQKQISLPFLSNVYQLFSSVAMINSLTYVKRFLTL